MPERAYNVTRIVRGTSLRMLMEQEMDLMRTAVNSCLGEKQESEVCTWIL